MSVCRSQDATHPADPAAPAESDVRLTFLAATASWAHSIPALPLLHMAARHLPRICWNVVRAAIADSPTEAARRVHDQAPDVLAATVYLFNRRFVLDVCARVKALVPNSLVILGGPEWLGPNETALRSLPFVDAVVRGEGEVVFPEILERIAAGQPWDDLPGLCCITEDGAYRDNGFAVPPRRLPAGGPPTESQFFEWNKPFVSFETARGCPFACTFCTSAVVGRPVRRLDPGEIRTVLDAFRENGVREVRVLDRTFNSPPERAQGLLALFREYCPDVRFHIEWRPDILTGGLCEELARWPAGRLHIEAGVQTTARHVDAAIRRGGDPDAVLPNLRRLCAMQNLAVHVDLVTGLPLQTLDDVFDDLDAVLDTGPEEIQIERLKLLPGVPLASSPSASGLTAAPNPPYEILRTPHMSADDLRVCDQLSRIVDALYNRPELRDSLRIAWREQPGFFRNFTSAVGRAFAVPTSMQRRFRLFHQYATAHDLLRTRESLELAWLRAGFSPRHGIARAEAWRGPVPDDVRFDAGDMIPAGADRPRVWRYRGCTTEYWILSYGPRRTVVGRRSLSG